MSNHKEKEIISHPALLSSLVIVWQSLPCNTFSSFHFSFFSPHYQQVIEGHGCIEQNNIVLCKFVVQTTQYSEVQNIFSTNNLQNIFQSNDNFELKTTLEKLQKSKLLNQENSLKTHCALKPKLRTFMTFKDCHTTPSYISKPLCTESFWLCPPKTP